MVALAGKAVPFSLVVSERGESRTESERVVRSLGDGIHFETRHLHEYCYQTPSPMSHDVALLLGAVRLADRSFRRHHSRSWTRILQVELPVFCLKEWRREDVASRLKSCLDYLTGDDWRFNFEKRRRQAAAVAQAHLLSAPAIPRVFVPFSHGLDSYAQCAILANQEKVETVPVNINANRRDSVWTTLGRRGRVRSVPISSRVDEPHHSEASFRTRAFIFNLMAAYGAVMSEAGRVLVPENGQGSLGPSLVPLGNEAPHRSCHPGFTTRLGQFVQALTGHTVRFEHPALFMTKGLVLRKLADLQPNTKQWLERHWSCSYDARHAHVRGRRVHCGLCGNCLLRRVSLKAAGVEDSTVYLAMSTHAPTLEASFDPEYVPRELKAYRDLAFNAARSMQRLADLALTPNAPRVWAEIEALARYRNRPLDETESRMRSFLSRHQQEWSAFLDECGSASWVSQFARG